MDRFHHGSAQVTKSNLREEQVYKIETNILLEIEINFT